MQDTVYVLSAIFMGLFIAVFAFVFFSSRKSAEYGPIQKKGARIRKYYFLGLVLLFLIVTGFTVRDLPFERPQNADEIDAVVDVVGKQFMFEVSQTEFKVGQTVQFNVTSQDVNHGFGLYAPNMRMIAQTQAMPGYTNSVYVTFDKPGTYKILCMEYCGLGHHVMISEITVTE
jgi:cytochrome c oxidase subunit 2